MKYLQSLLLAGTLASNALADPIPPGTIIPTSITYSIGQPDTNNQFLENLQLSDFGQYDGQVILLVYHASW